MINTIHTGTRVSLPWNAASLHSDVWTRKVPQDSSTGPSRHQKHAPKCAAALCWLSTINFSVCCLHTFHVHECVMSSSVVFLQRFWQCSFFCQQYCRGERRKATSCFGRVSWEAAARTWRRERSRRSQANRSSEWVRRAWVPGAGRTLERLR